MFCYNLEIMKTVGIIGKGNFGSFMGSHLEKHLEVSFYDKDDPDEQLRSVCDSDVVIFAVPFFSLEPIINKTKDLISSNSIICDVTSIKQKPLGLLKTAFPNNQILGTHPIFGPQSGKNGITGLPIVLSNISCTEGVYALIKQFLASKLELKVIEQTPDQHDQEMAYIQGLAHFVGRALKNLDIKDYETSTFSYHQLVELTDLLKDDSWELFRTIQEANPYAQEVRDSLRAELDSLEKKLES